MFKKYATGRRVIGYPERGRKKVKKYRLPGVSILPLPDVEPMILFGDDDGFKILDQSKEVQIEKSMISDETNIPSSTSNRINRHLTRIKHVFHKDAPTAITSTKTRTDESSNRDITKVNYNSIVFMLFIVWLVYKTLKVK